MWHYLYFIVLVKVKDPTEYTGPESYVAQMIAVSEAQPLLILQLRSRHSSEAFSVSSPLPSSRARHSLALTFCEPLNKPVGRWRISTLLTSSLLLDQIYVSRARITFSQG